MDILVSFSGGIDSSVLVAQLLKEGHSVRCVAFSYGSKHNTYELDAMRWLCKFFGLPYRIFDLNSIFSCMDSSLLNNTAPIPEGHYESPEMKKTIVPGRNMIFASILTGVAESSHSQAIALGIHQGDHVVYPDCRPKFALFMNQAIQAATDYKIKLITPFINLNKSTIVKLGNELKVPFGLTRTCYKDQLIACGKCGSCVERLEAFEQNGLKDPITYEDKNE